MYDSVVLVNAMLNDPEERAAAIRLARIREEALDIIAKVPAYANASREERNYLYDVVKEFLESQVEE